jgi:oxygen-dependent protoporphyrinogen oxidase
VIAIIGGGIAGLAAAYELHRQGVPFVVLERADRVGGVIRTEQVEGFTIDAGPDALLGLKPAGLALCRELGLGDRLFPTRKPRTAFIVRNQTLHPIPEASVIGIPRSLDALARSGLFSLAGKVRMAADLVIPPKRDAADESIASFMGRRFGREAVRYLAEPLLAGIHAGDVDRLSMQALFPRFVEAEQKHGSLLRAFRVAPEPRSADGVFFSLPGGLSELVASLVSTLPPASIRTSDAIIRLTPGPPFTIESAHGRRIAADAVIVATPAYVAGDLFDPLDPSLADLCRGIRYGSSATVALGYEPSQLPRLDGSGFVVPRVEARTLMAATFVSSKWPRRAPGDRVLLRGFVGGERDPNALDRTDEQLRTAVHEELGARLGITGQPVLSRVYRWVRANPQYEVGHLDRVGAIDRKLRAFQGLHVTGSGFRSLGIADCVADGRGVASAAARELSNR